RKSTNSAQWPFWYQVLLWGANILNSLGFGVCFTFLALFPRPSFHSKWIWGLVWNTYSRVGMRLELPNLAFHLQPGKHDSVRVDERRTGGVLDYLSPGFVCDACHKIPAPER